MYITNDASYAEFIDYIERDIMRAYNMDNIHHRHPTSWKNGKIYYQNELLSAARFIVNELISHTPPEPSVNIYSEILHAMNRMVPNIPGMNNQLMDLQIDGNNNNNTLSQEHIQSYRTTMKIFLNMTLNMTSNVAI